MILGSSIFHVLEGDITHVSDFRQIDVKHTIELQVVGREWRNITQCFKPIPSLQLELKLSSHIIVWVYGHKG